VAKKKPDDNPVLATNKKAFHDYNILERFEAGIKLVGTEVKSCRERAVVISDGYVKIQNGNAMLLCAQISHYGYGNRFNHDMRQPRQLLLHKREILKLSQWLGSKGGTIVPLKMYLKQGLIKVEIAYCQGKTHADQRETLKKRQADLEMRRAMKR
jgi:SsrA-binding protein